MTNDESDTQGESPGLPIQGCRKTAAPLVQPGPDISDFSHPAVNRAVKAAQPGRPRAQRQARWRRSSPLQETPGKAQVGPRRRFCGPPMAPPIAPGEALRLRCGAAPR